METESKTTLKDKRLEIDALVCNKIKSQKAFREAVKTLFEFAETLDHLKGTLKACQSSHAALAAACADYAAGARMECHSEIQNGENGVLQNYHEGVRGTWSGDVVCDGKTYHLLHCVDKVVRADGDTLTQAFLKALPEGWTRSRLELAKGKILDDVPDSMLAKKGLTLAYANRWATKDEA